MITEIRTAIKNKLDTLVGDDNPLVNVFDYFPVNLEGYPSVMFEPAGLDSAYMTTNENYRTYKFKLVLVQEFSVVGRQKAIDIILEAFDQIVDTFDSDYTLGGVVDKVEAVPGDFGTLQFESGLSVYFEIILSCSVLKPLDTF